MLLRATAGGVVAEVPEGGPVDHAVPLVAAFDTATVFAMSFGIAKFHLAQHRVRFVREYVSRDGRSPNPDLIQTTNKWPPVSALQDFQPSSGRRTMSQLSVDEVSQLGKSWTTKLAARLSEEVDCVVLGRACTWPGQATWTRPRIDFVRLLGSKPTGRIFSESKD